MTREELDFIGAMNLCDEISNEAYKKIICHCEGQEPKTDRLYGWLNDMRFGIAPDETTPQSERAKRLAQIEIIDDIMEWLEKNGQEPKMGHWIYGIDEDTGKKDLYAWTCSECGGKHPWQPKYCPNCGAKMQEAQE